MLQGMKINAKTAEEHELVETVAGMRYRIEEFRLHDGLTRRVFDLATVRGMSEYETIVLLAYSALCGREAAQDAYTEHLNLCATPRPIILKRVTGE